MFRVGAVIRDAESHKSTLFKLSGFGKSASVSFLITDCRSLPLCKRQYMIKATINELTTPKRVSLLNNCWVVLMQI